jgi:hypothetical protein
MCATPSVLFADPLASPRSRAPRSRSAEHPFPFASLVVRTIGNPHGIESAVKDQLRQVDPDQGVAQVETIEKRDE